MLNIVAEVFNSSQRKTELGQFLWVQDSLVYIASLEISSSYSSDTHKLGLI